MTRYGGIISSYQETLAELDKITGTTAPAAKFYIHIPVSTQAFMLTRTKLFCYRSYKHTCEIVPRYFRCPWCHGFLECVCSGMIIQVFWSSILKSFFSFLIMVRPWMYRKAFFYLSKGLKVNIVHSVVLMYQLYFSVCKILISFFVKSQCWW